MDKLYKKTRATKKRKTSMFRQGHQVRVHDPGIMRYIPGRRITYDLRRRSLPPSRKINGLWIYRALSACGRRTRRLQWEFPVQNGSIRLKLYILATPATKWLSCVQVLLLIRPSVQLQRPGNNGQLSWEKQGIASSLYIVSSSRRASFTEVCTQQYEPNVKSITRHNKPNNSMVFPYRICNHLA